MMSSDSTMKKPKSTTDRQRMDWLQGRIVDTIYLDDGKSVDVRGLDVRAAIDKAMTRWPGSLEDDDAEGDRKVANGN